MKTDCYIGIDTSNYTTSLSAASADGEILCNLKAPLPVKDGACGLRQSEAVFAHIKNLPAVFDRLREYLDEHTLRAVGVSTRPRDAADSYMPCFLSGVAAAHALAAGLSVPIFEFSHQNGHIMAALASSGAATALEGRQFGAFHVSGGTTEMLLVRPCGCNFSVETVGGSADLHAGQAVDRVGVSLGLSFPCGPALEKLATENTRTIPPGRICVKDGYCHLSGLENLASALYEKEKDPALTAAFVFRFISDTLCKMAEELRRKYPGIPLVFAGGVMSNALIAADLREKLGADVYFAKPEFSSDNAAGIALLCRRAAGNF